MVTERLTVSIMGMACADCAARIEKALREREGVIRADVNLAAQQVIVTYDPYAVAPRQLTELIEHLGYEAPRWAARRVKEAPAPRSSGPNPIRNKGAGGR